MGPAMGVLFWNLTLFCGFLVLATASLTTAEGALRRWVDIFWTASPRLRTWDPSKIGRLFFGSVVVYALFGLVLLNIAKPDRLIVWTTTFYNFALGLSCFHVIFVNRLLLPKEIKPSFWRCTGLVLAGSFYTFIACVATYDLFRDKTPPEPEQKEVSLLDESEYSNSIRPICSNFTQRLFLDDPNLKV